MRSSAIFKQDDTKMRVSAKLHYDAQKKKKKRNSRKRCNSLSVLHSANKRARRFIELIISTKRDTLTNSNETQRDNIGTIARAIVESARVGDGNQ